MSHFPDVCHSIANDARRPSPSCLGISPPELRRSGLACRFVIGSSVSFTSSSLSIPQRRTRLPAALLINPASTVSESMRSSILRYLTRFAGGTRHTEIFVFKRLQGKYRGKEWSTVIRPVIEKWARFVNHL